MLTYSSTSVSINWIAPLAAILDINRTNVFFNFFLTNRTNDLEYYKQIYLFTDKFSKIRLRIQPINEIDQISYSKF